MVILTIGRDENIDDDGDDDTMSRVFGLRAHALMLLESKP